MKKENILITGGAGYIGSVLTKLLVEKKYNVTIIDNFTFNKNSLLSIANNANLNIIKGDVRDKNLLNKLLKKNDIIIPLAALVGAPACEKDKTLAKELNINQIKNICKSTSINQKILFPVTNSGYGVGEKDIYCDENSKLRPISYYGKSKMIAENIVLDRGNCITFRLATVFGISPRMRIDLLVNDFVHRAVNDNMIVLYEPNFKRNYIHINDVANVFLFGIKKFIKLKNNTFNVGLSSANLSKIELCNKIKKYHKSLKIIEIDYFSDPDKRDYIVSNKKIEKKGWKPKHSIDDGIKELIKLYEWLETKTFSNI